MSALRTALALLVLVLVQAACLDDVDVPPKAPTLQPVESPTSVPRQTIRGTKPKGTGVLNFDSIIIPPDEEESWQYAFPLEVGENRIELRSEKPSGRRSKRSADALIVYQRPCPSSPSIELPPALTTTTSHFVTGTKPEATSLWLNDEMIVAFNAEKVWSHTINIPAVDDRYELTLIARDENDKESDPVHFAIQLDTAPPEVISRFAGPEWLLVDCGAGCPADLTCSVDFYCRGLGVTGAPTNAALVLGFDEPLGAEIDPGALIIEQSSTIVPGTLTYSVTSNALTWVPSAGELSPSTTYTVTLDPSRLPDRLGNTRIPNPGDTWEFTTATGPDASVPGKPEASAPTSVTTETVILAGAKAPWTSIWVNGDQAVAVNAETSWSYETPLVIGQNLIAVEARSLAGVATAADPLAVERILNRPAAPTLSADVDSEVSEPEVLLIGGKPAGTSILLNGNPIVCRDQSTTWSFVAELVPGINELVLQSRDETGALSEETPFVVDFTQLYSGTVPPGFGLVVYFSLRDLARVPDIQGEFDLGANFYAIDAWLEGPIGAGETCALVDRERQNIKYVATIQSYIGSKDGYQVPFSLTDYRGTDFLAALIHGGVFSFLGLDAGSERRDANGRQVPGLFAGVTATDLRESYDCLGEIGSSACTQATVGAGPQAVGPWSPKARGANGLLPQGDYLLYLQLNLDRDPTWLLANDFETCWGDPDDNGRGMHRVVRRVSLGSVSYSVELPQSEEKSGPDHEGSGRLHYLDRQGVRIYWGPG